MKTIKLSMGQFAMVDDEDFEYLSQWKWSTVKGKHTFYAVRRGPNNSKIIMHRLLMGFPEQEIDHWDRNGLNNQRENLRVATTSQNQANRRVQRASHGLPFKGIYKPPKRTKWQARICFNNRMLHIGCFPSAVEAAHAYDKRAQELFGEFALLNFR